MGIPSPASQARSMRMGENGLVEQFVQNGWNVRYLAYRQVEFLALQSIELPSLLSLSRDSWKVTIATKGWRLIKFTRLTDQII